MLIIVTISLIVLLLLYSHPTTNQRLVCCSSEHNNGVSAATFVPTNLFLVDPQVNITDALDIDKFQVIPEKRHSLLTPHL